MSLFSQQQADAAEAQEFIAQMMGKPATAVGNTLYRGGNLTLIYGLPRVVEPMNPGGGFRPRVELPATGTRVQFGAAPVSKETLTRVDLTPHITYSIDSVDVHDSLIYALVLVKVGK